MILGCRVVASKSGVNLGNLGRRAASAMAFHELSDTQTDGSALDFGMLKGKVAYCVNVASQ